MLQAWGWRGALLVYIANSVLGIYYFSLALMNHNGAPTSPSHTALAPPPPPPPNHPPKHHLCPTLAHRLNLTSTFPPPTPTPTPALTRRAHA